MNDSVGEESVVRDGSRGILTEKPTGLLVKLRSVFASLDGQPQF